MHERDIFLWGAAAFLLGIGCALTFSVPGVLITYVSVFLAVFIAFSVYFKNLRFFAVCLFLLLLGVVRGVNGPIAFGLLDPVRRPLESAGESFGGNILRALPEPHASYLAGVVIGARSTIPYDLKEAFRKTGTSHLIALSGYNVSVIIEYIGFVTRSLWFSLGGILFFVLATGASSSVVRAAIMGSLVFFARHYGYEYGARNALSAAIVVMVFFSPPILLLDIGFQLSVGATAGLIAFSEYFQKKLTLVPEKFRIRESLATTLAAQLATLPIIFYYFGGVSLWSPVVNTLILGTIPLTMFLGFLVGVAGYISSYLSVIIAWPAYLILGYQLFIIRFFASINVF